MSKCTKCSGSVFREEDYSGVYGVCINCGYTVVIQALDRGDLWSELEAGLGPQGRLGAMPGRASFGRVRRHT